MAQEDSSLVGWALAGVGGVVSGLLSGLVYIFQLRENENAKNIAEIKSELVATISKADKCEEDRTKLFTKCAVLEEKIFNLESKVSNLDANGTKYSHRLKGNE